MGKWRGPQKWGGRQPRVWGVETRAVTEGEPRVSVPREASPLQLEGALLGAVPNRVGASGPSAGGEGSCP